MSPTYSIPSIDTIHQGEQLFTVPDLYYDQAACYRLGGGPRERTIRPLSSRSDSYKHRSGSPQVHPNLKASPGTATEDSRSRASNIPVLRPSLRRYSSIDFSALKASHSGALGAHEFESPRVVREQKRARRSPSPRRPKAFRSSSFRGIEEQPGSSSGSSLTIKESRREDQDSGLAQKDEAASHVPGECTGSLDDAFQFLNAGHETRIDGDVDAIQSSSNDAPWAAPSAGDTPRSSSPVSSTTSLRSAASSSKSTVDTEISAVDGDGEEHPVPTFDPFTTAHPHYIQPVPNSSSIANRRSHRRAASAIAHPNRYGTPEMPRGPAKLPHLPIRGLTPRVPAQSHPKHLPRAEKLPKSGYDLLASTISSSAVPSSASAAAQRNSRLSSFFDTPPPLAPSTIPRRQGSRRHSSASLGISDRNAARQSTPPLQQQEDELTIKPIYRRFESLNHRLLLHLQDELSELEEQLHRLDTTDTQTRRLQSSILPASRRAEFLAGGELQWQKTDILSKIAFKLGQYNHTLSSFTSTRDLPAPSHTAVSDYRDYLATHRPISDVETRFLDSGDDLVTLEAPADSSSSSTCPHHPIEHDKTGDGEYLRAFRDDEQMLAPTVTPIPGTMHGNSWLLRHHRPSSGSQTSGSSRSVASSASGGASPKFALGPPPRQQPPSPLRKQHRAPPAVMSDSDAGYRRKKHGAAQFGAQKRAQRELLLLHLATAGAVAVLVPMLAFSIIPGFVARMIVVWLVGLSVVGSVAQSVGGLKRAAGSRGDVVCSVGIYAGVMAVVAGVMA